MADDLSVANAARVSFARRKEALDDSDRGLIRFLMRDRHGTPFEHNSFRFHIRCPIFVAREWMRHRIGCLTGDTVVTFVNTYGHAVRPAREDPGSALGDLDRGRARWARTRRRDRPYRVRELCNDGRQSARNRRSPRRRSTGSAIPSSKARTGRRDGRWRIRGMSLRVLDESTNEFTIRPHRGHRREGDPAGLPTDPCRWKVRSLSPQNHRVLTDEGWRTMREALGLDGDGDAARMTRPARFVTNGTPAYPGPRVASDAPTRAGKSVARDRRRRRLQLPHRPEMAEGPRPAVHARGALPLTVPWNKGRRGYRTSL